MIFPADFLTFIIYGALGWCALTALGLTGILIRDIARGEAW